MRRNCPRNGVLGWKEVRSTKTYSLKVEHSQLSFSISNEMNYCKPIILAGQLQNTVNIWGPQYYNYRLPVLNTTTALDSCFNDKGRDLNDSLRLRK